MKLVDDDGNDVEGTGEEASARSPSRATTS